MELLTKMQADISRLVNDVEHLKSIGDQQQLKIKEESTCWTSELFPIVEKSLKNSLQWTKYGLGYNLCPTPHRGSWNFRLLWRKLNSNFPNFTTKILVSTQISRKNKSHLHRKFKTFQIKTYPEFKVLKEWSYDLTQLTFNVDMWLLTSWTC